MVPEYVIIIAIRNWYTISQSNVCICNGFHRLISIINSIFSLSFWFTSSYISHSLCKVLSHSSVDNSPCSLLEVPESEDMKVLWTLVTPAYLMSQSKWQRPVELCYPSVARMLGTSCGCSTKLFAMGSAVSRCAAKEEARPPLPPQNLRTHSHTSFQLRRLSFFFLLFS